MTIDYRLLVGHILSPSEIEYVQGLISGTFAEVDAVYNKWNPDSEISKLNRLPKHVSWPLSEQLHAFLLAISDVVKLTEGLFDPTVAPLYDLWQSHLERGMRPKDPEIARVATSVGWHKLHFENGDFLKTCDGMALDLGGIAKGYCVDLLTERLQAAGFANLFVEWGGEIRTCGLHPEGRAWAVSIQGVGDEEAARPHLASMWLSDAAIATSGDYLQNWTIQTKAGTTCYFHIIHPKLHHPLRMTGSSVTSASVRAANCMLADGLATALMMFPSPTEATSWMHERKKIVDVDFWVF